MIVIVDERELVTDGYVRSFRREGIASAGFEPPEFKGWVAAAAEADVSAVQAFLLGDCAGREAYPSAIRNRSAAPLIAMNEQSSLEETLRLFDAGVDDVVRKPVHVRELIARVGAIRSRRQAGDGASAIGDIRVYSDGSDPLVAGERLQLPRRERRILEYLAASNGRRVTKTQIFNAIYGIFDEDVEEQVVESHISKLRKKLRARLGYDPIDSRRYLGYRLGTD